LVIANDHRNDVEAEFREPWTPFCQPACSQSAQALLLVEPNGLRRFAPARGTTRFDFAEDEHGAAGRNDVDLTLSATVILFDDREAKPAIVAGSQLFSPATKRGSNIHGVRLGKDCDRTEC
jgi:hypothetical protein